MGTTSKRSTDSQFLGHRWFLLQVRCSILHIVRASHSTNDEECSNVLERTLQSECFGAKVKIGVRTYPHVANAICGVRCVNVCISEKNGMCDDPIHNYTVAIYIFFFLKTYRNHEPDLSPQGDRNTCHTCISQYIMRLHLFIRVAYHIIYKLSGSIYISRE